MGTAKLNILIISVFCTALFSSKNLMADAGDTAKEWAMTHARSISERLCRTTISRTLNQLFFTLHTQIHTIQGDLKKLTADILKTQEELLAQPLKTNEISIEDLYQILENQKNTLKSYDQVYVYLQKLLLLSISLDNSRQHLFELTNKKNIARLFQRPTLNTHSLIVDVKLFDGVNGVASTNPIEWAIKGGKALYESAKNLEKNKKTNKKLQEARDLFNSLQVTQDEFEEMLWQDFSLRKTPYEASLKDIRENINHNIQYTQNFLKKILEHFSYLDSLREILIKNYHTQIADSKLATLKKTWHIQEMRLFLQTFKGHLNVLKFKATLNNSKPDFERLSLMVKLGEENLKTYEKFLEASK